MLKRIQPLKLKSQDKPTSFVSFSKSLKDEALENLMKYAYYHYSNKTNQKPRGLSDEWRRGSSASSCSDRWFPPEPSSGWCQERAKITGRVLAPGSKYKIQQSRAQLEKNRWIEKSQSAKWHCCFILSPAQQSTFLCLPELFERWWLHHESKPNRQRPVNIIITSPAANLYLLKIITMMSLAGNLYLYPRDTVCYHQPVPSSCSPLNTWLLTSLRFLLLPPNSFMILRWNICLSFFPFNNIIPLSMQLIILINWLHCMYLSFGLQIAK